MTLRQTHPEPMPGADENSTVYSGTTPPETLASDGLLDEQDPLGAGISPPVPWPGSTFLIRHMTTGRLLTLSHGSVTLSPATSLLGSSIHWTCVETKGWLGFRNTASGSFLGHNSRGFLCCSAGKHQGWENFCVRARPEGGCVLLMQHYERLWHVGTKVEGGREVLAKVSDGGEGGLTWEFVKV